MSSPVQNYILLSGQRSLSDHFRHMDYSELHLNPVFLYVVRLHPEYLCGGISDASSVSWYYDSDWNICEKQDASYQMLLELSSSRYEKTGILSFYRIDADHALLHSTELRFPSIQSALKEEES